MQSLTGKATGDTLTATEWNQLPQEVQNVITALGQSLSNGDLNQLGKAIAGYAASSEFFTDSGTANAINLVPGGSLQAPTSFQNGMRVRLRKGITNTSNVTLVVGSLASKKVLDQTGSALASGDLTAGLPYEFWYDITADSAAGAWIYKKPSSLTNSLPRNYIDGLILSNNATTPATCLDIAAGTCKDSANTTDFTLASAMSKQITATWTQGGTPGTPVGGFPSGLTSGAPVNNTWYMVFAIWKPSGQVDFGFDISSNAAQLMASASGSGYTKYRQIGWIRYGVGTILKFFQNGNNFEYDVPIQDIFGLNTANTDIKTVTAPPNTKVDFAVFVANSDASSSNTVYMKLRQTQETSAIAGSAGFDMQAVRSAGAWTSPCSGKVSQYVDSSSQLKLSVSDTARTFVTLSACGWTDYRGQQ